MDEEAYFCDAIIHSGLIKKCATKMAIFYFEGYCTSTIIPVLKPQLVSDLKIMIEGRIIFHSPAGAQRKLVKM